MYSPFNTKGTTKQKMHDDMLSRAQSFLNETVAGDQNVSFPSFSRHKDSTPPPHRSLIILTAQRNERYLDVLLWSLLEYNDLSQLNSSTSLTLINTERPPESNVDLRKWRSLLPNLNVRNIDNSNTTSSAGRPSSSSWIRRGVSDYLVALEWCRQEESQWCVILEEDTVLSRNFLQQLQQQVEIPLTAKRIHHDHLGMVKLFVSDHWDGFSSEWVHVLDVAIILSVSVVFASTFLLLLRPSSSSTYSTLPTTTVTPPRNDMACRKWLMACACSFIGFYVMCRLIGRQALVNVVEGKGVHLDRIGTTAGTVAITYPQSAVPHVIKYLQEQLKSPNVRPIDVALNGWLESTSFRALRTRPSLVQHIGAYSSASYKNQGDFQEMKQDSSFEFR